MVGLGADGRGTEGGSLVMVRGLGGGRGGRSSSVRSSSSLSTAGGGWKFCLFGRCGGALAFAVGFLALARGGGWSSSWSSSAHSSWVSDVSCAAACAGKRKLDDSPRFRYCWTVDEVTLCIAFNVVHIKRVLDACPTCFVPPSTLWRSGCAENEGLTMVVSCSDTLLVFRYRVRSS